MPNLNERYNAFATGRMSIEEEKAFRREMEEQTWTGLPGHSEECALNCDHCHHGSDCYKFCCWCSGVRDGEGNVSMEFVECDCEAQGD